MKQNLIDVNLSAFPPPTPADLQKNANIFLLQIGACMSVFPSCFPLIGLYTLVFFFFQPTLVNLPNACSQKPWAITV